MFPVRSQRTLTRAEAGVSSYGMMLSSSYSTAVRVVSMFAFGYTNRPGHRRIEDVGASVRLVVVSSYMSSYRDLYPVQLL